jgi:hypothetical protein
MELISRLKACTEKGSPEYTLTLGFEIDRLAGKAVAPESTIRQESRISATTR